MIAIATTYWRRIGKATAKKLYGGNNTKITVGILAAITILFVLALSAQVKHRPADMDSMALAVQKYVAAQPPDTAARRPQYQRDFIMLYGDTLWYYMRSYNFYENEAMVRVFMLTKEQQTRIERLEQMVDYLLKKGNE